MNRKHVSWLKRLAALAFVAAASGSMTMSAASDPVTETPIKHVVVIFQENVSFDHYFGTYPIAANDSAFEPFFEAAPGTPSVNGLLTGPAAPPNNPTLNVAGNGTVQPFRLSRSQATTCDEDHNYTDEQAAYHGGQMDLVVQKLSSTSANCAPDKSTVMGYYDGNTVTAMWNYAQHFAINDNSFSTTYGPSTPGALSLISGNTHGVVGSNSTINNAPGINQTTGVPGTQNVTLVGSDAGGSTGGGSIIGDPRPVGDPCNPLGSSQVQLSNPSFNVGDLLNARRLTWGWFQGGFKNCSSIHKGSDGSPKQDYIGHHEPFQYFPSTRNLNHLPPTSASKVGVTDQANHQYDLDDLFSINETSGAASRTYEITGFKPGVTLPSVSFLKAPGFMDGHAQYSDPLLEQHFLVQVINTIMKSKYWKDTAIIVLYDDSDGWYDHVYPPLVNPSDINSPSNSADALTGPGQCGLAAVGSVMGRCGYGPRQPFLVISPFARPNFVDHTVTDLSSVLRFVEDNFFLGRLDQLAPKSVAAGGSFDQIAGSIESMFDFSDNDSDDQNGRAHENSNSAKTDKTILILDPDSGLPVRSR